jgi:hypothetical protein
MSIVRRLNLDFIPCLFFLAYFFGTVDSSFSQPDSVPKVGTVVQYVQGDLFDNELHDALAADTPEVRVDPVSKFSVSELPQPILKWLAAVKSKGGGYKFIDESKAPSDVHRESSEVAALLFEIIRELWNVIKEMLLYSPAKNYKAEVYYKTPSDLTVTKILFKRLPQ